MNHVTESVEEQRTDLESRADAGTVNELIWVNEDDEVVGYGEKLLTHRERRLHRAFSVYLYDTRSKRILLQKRASGKYHSGGLWSNTCCSHPYRRETFPQSVRRCMRDEIGIAPYAVLTLRLA